MFSLLRELSNCFQNGCTVLHFYQQCRRFPFLQILAYTSLSAFLMEVVLVGVSCDFDLHFPIGNGIEHFFFMYLLAICIFSFVEMFGNFPHFKIGLFIIEL